MSYVINEEEDGMNTGMKIDKSKNKGASSLQITAEQIIRASQAHVADEEEIRNTVFDSQEELDEYKARKRKKFEEQTQRQRNNVSSWFKYADWEENLGEIKRARNIFERALENDYKNVSIWLRYAEMEMRNKNINHARNVWERSIKLLPRIDQLWYKYAYMEELLGNYVGSREIFKAWMSWIPSENGWMCYAKFEERMGEMDKAREVLYKYIESTGTLAAYIKVAKFEEKHNNLASARAIFESALSDLGDKALDEDFFILFIKFELKMKEIDRARVLFKFGLDRINQSISKEVKDYNDSQGDVNAKKLFAFYLKFQKMYGNKEDTDLIIYNKRRRIYEDELKKNIMNYDTWFNYIQLEEEISNNSIRVREIYERAITNIPTVDQKKYWRRYIYIWISYALYEETSTLDIERANSIYIKIIEIVPHKIFTFSKIWILYGQFLIRQHKINECRNHLGKSIGLHPNIKVFRAYIEIELQLGEIDRCRKLHEKWIECFSDSSQAWIEYASFERELNEIDRCRSILEVAVSQNLSMPELVWKFYINSELEDKNYEKVASLYNRLLQKSKHIKVWQSYSKFHEEVGEIAEARKTIMSAHAHFKSTNQNEFRAEILYYLKEFESRIDLNSEHFRKAESILPKKVKKRRAIIGNYIQTLEGEDDSEAFEEYYDYIFPEDVEKSKNFKLLEMANAWKENNYQD